MTELEKMLSGEMYFPSDKTLTMMRVACRQQLDVLNRTCQSEHKARTQLLKKLFGGAKVLASDKKFVILGTAKR